MKRIIVTAFIFLLVGCSSAENDIKKEIENETVVEIDEENETEDEKHPAKVMISYETNGGEFLKGWNWDYGSTISYPTIPIKEGFSFDGWYSDSDLKTEVVFPLTMKEETKLYAKWTEPVVIDISDVETLELDSGTLMITDYTGNEKGIIIPEYLNNQKVTAIGSGAFRSKHLYYIELPNSLEVIDSYAFKNNLFPSIVIPSGVKLIGNAAFEYTGLRNLVLEEGVEEIGRDAFSSSFLENVQLPDSLRIINNNAFDYNNIRSIKLPKNLEHIGDSAFEATILTQISIPKSVMYIGKKAFNYTNISTFRLPLHYGGNDDEANWKDSSGTTYQPNETTSYLDKSYTAIVTKVNEVYYTKTDLNLRKVRGYPVYHNVKTVIPKGSEITVLHIDKNKVDGIVWAYVEYSGSYGFVSSYDKYIEKK